MKKYIYSVIIFCYCVLAFAASPVVLSELFVSFRHIDEGNQYHQMPSVGSEEHKNRKSELNIVFHISDPKQLKEVELLYGTTSGSGNLVTMKLTYEEKNGEQFLVHGQKTFLIYNNNVNLTALIPESIVKNTSYTTIKATDKSGVATNVLTKRMN
ncbi:MAG: hypothetical protein ACTHJT_09135 [Cytophaga sp.]|uniref:hypothetical protein n=1 Tax=Cytophaga sp. TaxID=29535 RepID=UPI003F7E96AB